MVILKDIIPLVTVGIILFLMSRLFGHHNQIFAAIIREAKEAASLKPTLDAFNFLGFFATAAFMVFCFLLQSLHSILQMSLAGANDSASAIYEICAIAFCVLVLGTILIFSLLLCERARRSRKE